MVVEAVVALPPVYPDEPPASKRLPQWHRDWEPEPGDVYQNQRGNFMVVLGEVQGCWRYLNFDHDGNLMFDSQGTRRYFAQRKLVGRVRLPTLTVEPINA